jgi:hypothetical protein
VEDQAKQHPSSTAAEIVNFPKRVSAFGREYEIKRFTLGPLIRALPHIAPLGYLMRSVTRADASEILVNALALAGEPALGLISVATEEPVEWFEDKDPLDGLEILTEIVEANVPYFFDSANLERLKSAFARLGKVIEEHAPKADSGAQSEFSSVADMAH